MTDKERKRRNTAVWLMKIALLVYDIIAVNLSYYLALLVRFYVNHEIHEAGERFFPLFFRYSPYYTVICIIVFMAFRLYSGIWRYAGLKDMNRIIGANIVTLILKIFLILVSGSRMPFTYYAIGFIIQLMLIAISRFAYRIISDEFRYTFVRKSDNQVNVMIVGMGDSARILIHQILDDKERMIRPVCILNFRGATKGSLFNGLPVISGIENLRSGIEKYKVTGILIADTLMPLEMRQEIREVASELEIEVQDYSWYAQDFTNGISFMRLMEYTGGPVDIKLNGRMSHFENGESALQSLTGKYQVKSITASGGTVVVEIKSDNSVLNNTYDDWVKKYEEETGEEISFF